MGCPLKDQLSLKELEAKIFDSLREKPFYNRLKAFKVEPSNLSPQVGSQKSWVTSPLPSTQKRQKSSRICRSTTRSHRTSTDHGS
jgi:hypothetical protein